MTSIILVVALHIWLIESIWWDYRIDGRCNVQNSKERRVNSLLGQTVQINYGRCPNGRCKNPEKQAKKNYQPDWSNHWKLIVFVTIQNKNWQCESRRKG